MKPQINADKGAQSRASGGRLHVCPSRAYVSMHCGGHDADERRLIATHLCVLCALCGFSNRKIIISITNELVVW